MIFLLNPHLSLKYLIKMVKTSLVLIQIPPIFEFDSLIVLFLSLSLVKELSESLLGWFFLSCSFSIFEPTNFLSFLFSFLVHFLHFNPYLSKLCSSGKLFSHFSQVLTTFDSSSFTVSSLCSLSY